MTTEQIRAEIETIFDKYSLCEKLKGSLAIETPLTGEAVAYVLRDSVETLDLIIHDAREAQKQWEKTSIDVRSSFLVLLANKLAESADDLSKLVNYDSGKSLKESKGEVLSAIGLIGSIVKAASYEDLPSGAKRSKEFTPLGLIAVISPFNFPLAIGMWTGIPALLAGNTVINKPSENACLAAILYEAIFRMTISQFNATHPTINIPDTIFQVALGGPEVGKAMVSDQRVAKVIFTGSITGCEAVKSADVDIPGRSRALTEGGAANFAVFSNQHEGMTRSEFLDFAVGATLKSYLPFAGQKCVNTRQILVHADLFDDVVLHFRNQLVAFRNSWRIENAFFEDNPFEFAPLINRQAGERFHWAIQQTVEQGGEVIGGERLGQDIYPHARYEMPAIAVFRKHVPLMNEEIFGPFLILLPYSGDVSDALALAQKPNANLVNAFYGSDEREIAIFKRSNTAGFTLVNPPLGTGLLPPYGLGFGGNGLSGQGESLPRDPLSPFVNPEGSIKRTVMFKLPKVSV